MRNRFDQFGKQLLHRAFTPSGPVETDAEVPADTRRVDVWVLPDPARGGARADLGLLGRLGAGPSTFELYHCTPGGDELAGCMAKHHYFRHHRSLRDEPPPLPTQCVISSGRPDSGVDGLCFHAASGWPSGVYDGPSLLWTKLVVVSELPVERDTLLLRLLGADRVLAQAIAELKALPEDAPEHTVAWPVLVRFLVEVHAAKGKRTSEDEELIMATQDIVERFRNEAEEKGHKQGVQHTLVGVVIEAYETRFGSMPSELRTTIERTKGEAALRNWFKLAMTRSAEEIAAAAQAPRGEPIPATKDE